jgi:hypothetical protein
VTIAIAATVVVLLALALVVVAALDGGPPPSDVALAYEEAWDRFDFAALWVLSGDELRDGLGQADFVKLKSDAYRERQELGHLASRIAVEEVRGGKVIATVRTRIDLRDGSSSANDIDLEKRNGRWLVVAYRLEPSTPRSGA